MKFHDRSAWRRACIEVAVRRHNEAMARGCIKCGSAVPGRVCPDCYTCRACAPKCSECARLNAVPPV